VFVDHSKTSLSENNYSSFLVSLYVPVVFDHHRAISTILQDEQMYCVGPHRFTKEIAE